jgi:hypothetical protein
VSDGTRVEVDTRALEAGLRQLVTGVARGTGPVAGKTANAVAGRVRALVPVRTGRLRNTVTAEQVGPTATVRYGGGLPYAGYIDGRTHATTRGTEGAGATFYAACYALAAVEVHRL